MPEVALAASSKISAGAALADAGGNAVDAVLAAALVSMCTDIGIVSPGGGALITIWSAGADPVVIDGLPEMPGRGQSSERFGGRSTHHNRSVLLTRQPRKKLDDATANTRMFQRFQYVDRLAPNAFTV